MNNIIVRADNPNYLAKWNELEETQRYNGAYYYAHDIEKHIVPLIRTKRPISVIGMKECGGEDNMLVFVHHYVDLEGRYEWLRQYKNTVIVSSDREASKILSRYGTVVNLPLSVNVKEVAKHKVKRKTQKACYYGNPWSFKKQELAELVPPEVHRFGAMPREKAWDIIAQYKECYAIGLCAIEAQILGCRLKMSRYRYPDPEASFPILDCKDAAKMLQVALDSIDGTTFAS